MGTNVAPNYANLVMPYLDLQIMGTAMGTIAPGYGIH